MRLTERDRLVLARTLTFMLWFGMLLCTLWYSFWLGAAFAVYVKLDRLYYVKYWGPHSYPGDNS